MNKTIVWDWPGVTAWVLERAHALMTPTDCTSIGMVEGVLGDTRILGGVVFHNWTGRGGSVTVHDAGVEDTNWATRDFLWNVFDYAFNQLGCEVMVGPVPSTTERALSINERMGFKREAVIRGVFPDGDLVIMTMRRADCRFLRYRPRSIQAGLASQGVLSPTLGGL